MVKRRKNSKLYTANEVLHSLFQNSKSDLSSQFKRWRVWQYWPEIVGKTMAENSMPVSFFRGTLYVWVNSAPRMQDMVFMIRPIRQRINNYLGANYVRSIRLTLDRKSVPNGAEGLKELQQSLSKVLPEKTF